MSWEFASSPSMAALRALAAPASPVSNPHPHEDTAENRSAQAGRRTRPRTASPAWGVDGRAARPRRGRPFSAAHFRGTGEAAGQGRASAGHVTEADPQGGGEDSGGTGGRTGSGRGD